MSEDRDLERRLEAMFGSARPRRGFEDELWRKVEAAQPWPRRLLAWLAAPSTLLPVAGVAAVLLVVVGLASLLGNFHPAGGGAGTTSGGSAALAPSRTHDGAFGVLPGPGGGPKAANLPPSLSQAEGNAAQEVGPSISVYRYRVPTADELNAAATRLSAQSGLQVSVDPGAVPYMSITNLDVPAGQDLPTAARAFLAAHDLLPGYQYTVVTEPGVVIFDRLIDGHPMVGGDLTGSPWGLTVAFQGGAIVAVSGPLELPLEAAMYPTRRAAGQVAYVLVAGGAYGYYEPVLLTPNGVQSLISAQWLRQ